MEIEEPIEAVVDGESHWFCCRLFQNAKEAESTWRRVSEATSETWLTCMWAPEPELGDRFGVILFGTDRDEMVEHLDLLATRGIPYRSDHLADAVHHRARMLKAKEMGQKYTAKPDGVTSLPADRLK